MTRKDWPPQDWDALEKKLADKFELTVISINQNNTNKMKKTAKIESAKFSRTWDGPNGAIHYYDLILNNGDKGQIGTKVKDNPKLEVGSEITYILEAKGEYKGVTQYSIKLQQDENATPARSFGGYQKNEDPETKTRIARSVALAEAVALHTGLGLSALPYDVVNTALYFQHYVETGINLHADGATDAIANRDSDNDNVPF